MSATEVKIGDAIPLREFLENAAPGSDQILCKVERSNSTSRIILPGIALHCDVCHGIRTFRPHPPGEIWSGDTVDHMTYAHYLCSNCWRSLKSFAVWAKTSNRDGFVMLTKLGELPGFGPPIDRKLSRLLGDLRALFFQGRRCEAQGLGIGAFVYYRRVLDGLRLKILDEVFRVAQLQGPASDLAGEIQAAKLETQFTRSVDVIKSALPQVLLVQGQNPLLLLHDALSQGVHGHSDRQCLGLATSIRIVLAALAERIDLAMRDDQALNGAIDHLLSVRRARADEPRAADEGNAPGASTVGGEALAPD